MAEQRLKLKPPAFRLKVLCANSLRKHMTLTFAVGGEWEKSSKKFSQARCANQQA